ncbi:MAG: sigma-70 family RNA polymerase sigma factor [Bacteroidota bacterium]
MKFREDQYYIEKVLNGNIAAYRQLVEKHQDFVFTIVRKIVNSPEEAEEVAQDIFVKAYKKLPDFHGKAKFSTWLYRIAYNTAISHTRKRKVEFLSAEDHMIEKYSEDEILQGIQGLSSKEQKSLINNAMATLPKTDSLIITLFYFHEKGLEEIGEIVGMTQNNVKVKLHRIRKRLLIEMNDILGKDVNTVA